MGKDLPSANFYSRLGLLLAALGVPAFAVFFTKIWILQHPRLALGLALLYELFIWVFRFANKIWQRLQSRWVARVAKWLDTRVQLLFSSYRKHYLQDLIYRHRDFDVKGLSTQGIYTLELEQVFVELSVAPQLLHQTSADPIRKLPEKLREGQHSIWEFLQSGQMAKQNFAIIGPPGSGKTTLLKHMTLMLAGDKKRRKQN
ncbi:MAG: hypothetical protein ACRENG_13835, partial [bacterium]